MTSPDVVERLRSALNKAKARMVELHARNPGHMDNHAVVQKWCDEIDDALASIPLVETQAGWRDIESAPKDETEIILTDGEYVAADHWVRWGGGGQSWDEFRHLKPTHWQPLPAPPEKNCGSDAHS